MRVTSLPLLAATFLAMNLTGCGGGAQGGGGPGAGSGTGITPTVAGPDTEPHMFERKLPSGGAKPPPAEAKPQEKTAANRGHR
jgi:hypothetical protein